MTPSNSASYDVIAIMVSAATPDFSEVDRINRKGYTFLKAIYFEQVRKIVFIFGKLKHGDVVLPHE